MIIPVSIAFCGQKAGCWDTPNRKGFRNTPDKRRGIMGKLGNNPVTSAFSQEFDGKPEYTVEELSNMFSIAESMATAMGVALLMPRASIVRYVRNRGYKK